MFRLISLVFRRISLVFRLILSHLFSCFADGTGNFDSLGVSKFEVDENLRRKVNSAFKMMNFCI